MALPVCTHCEQYEGVLMVTTLTDGDTQVICPQDILLYALTLAATLTEGMTTEQASAYAEVLDHIYANDPRQPSKPQPKRASKAKDRLIPCPVCGQQMHANLSCPNADAHPSERPLDGAEGDAAALVALVPPCDQCGGTTATGDAAKLVCNECGAVIATHISSDLTPGGNDA